MSKKNSTVSNHPLIGETIKCIRPMTLKEIHDACWCHGTSVIEFESGALAYASCDPEGNGPGCLFAVDSESNDIYV